MQALSLCCSRIIKLKNLLLYAKKKGGVLTLHLVHQPTVMTHRCTVDWRRRWRWHGSFQHPKGCAAYFTAIDAGLVSIPAEHRPTWLKHALVGVGVEMWVVVVVFVTPRLVEFVKRTSRFIVGSNDAAAATKSKAE